MRRAWPLLLMGAVLAGGCGEAAHAPLVEPQPETTAQPAVIPSSLSYDGTLGLLSISAKALPEDMVIPSVTVGDSEVQVNQVFKSPANDKSQVPPALGAGYTAHAFENSSEGFGALYYGGKLALAMHRSLSIPNTEVERIQDFYAYRFRRRSDDQHTISDDKIRYWFWNDKNVRLVLVAVAKGNTDRYDLTEAIGDYNVMDALRLSPTKAAEDQSFLQHPTGKKGNEMVQHAG